MIILAGFLINSFFSGGLFFSLKAGNGRFSTNDFFRASSKNFWSFFSISLTMSLIILLLAILIVIIPVIIVSQERGISDYIVFGTGVIMTSIFLFILILIMLASDFARAWQIIHTNNDPFRAIGFGFSHTLRTFYSSYPLMLIMFLTQSLYTWLALIVIGGRKPITFAGIVLLFIFSQILFIIRVFLKICRYGSVTRMMEISG